MIDLVRTLVEILLKPLVIMVAILMTSQVFFRFNRRKTAKILLIIAGVWFFLIFFSPLPQWLLYQMESKYKTLSPLVDVGQEAHILILGGGHIIAPELPPSHQLNAAAVIRLVEGIRQYRSRPQSKIICSGGSLSGRTPHAQLLAMTAVELGVNPADTLCLVHPKNTREEAVDYVKRFGKNKRLILVTSAFHMPRALMYFHHLGIDPIPASTHEFVKMDPEGSTFNFKPSLMKIKMMEIVIHEQAGMLDATLFKDE